MTSVEPPDQLNGWKDIALYIGKSVRTAQRWERELGLPVRRIQGVAGEIVYALKAEIDAWTRQSDPRAGGAIAVAAAVPAAGRRSTTIGFIVLAALAASAATLVAVRMARRDPRPVSFRF